MTPSLLISSCGQRPINRCQCGWSASPAVGEEMKAGKPVNGVRAVDNPPFFGEAGGGSARPSSSGCHRQEGAATWSNVGAGPLMSDDRDAGRDLHVSRSRSARLLSLFMGDFFAVAEHLGDEGSGHHRNQLWQGSVACALQVDAERTQPIKRLVDNTKTLLAGPKSDG